MKNILILSLFILLFSCKKEENKTQTQTQTTTTESLLEYKWQLKESVQNNTIYPHPAIYTETFNSNHNYIYYDPPNSNSYDTLTWSLDNTQTIITFTNGCTPAGCFKYNILKLNSTEFWYYVDNNNPTTPYHCEYHFTH